MTSLQNSLRVGRAVCLFVLFCAAVMIYIVQEKVDGIGSGIGDMD